MSHRDTEQTGDNKVESPTPTNNTPPVPVPSSAASIHNQIQLLQALIELNQLQQQHQHTTPQQQPPLLSPQLLQLLQCPLPSAPLPLQNVLLPPPGLQPPLEDKNTPRQDSPQQFSPLQSLLQQTQFPTFPPIESLSPLRNPKQTRQDKPRTLCTQSTASQLSPPISTSTSLSTPASKPSDVEVGAINGIEVALSSYKIFRHKKFQMLIKIPPQIKQKLQLSCDDILIAGLNAKCCREGTDEEVGCCMQCSPHRKVITVGVSERAPFRSNVTSVVDSSPMEVFAFDDCKSNCSSSRDHLHTSLTLGVEILPGQILHSAPFVLQSRAVQSPASKNKRAPKSETTAAATTPQKRKTSTPAQQTKGTKQPRTSPTPLSGSFTTTPTTFTPPPPDPKKS